MKNFVLITVLCFLTGCSTFHDSLPPIMEADSMTISGSHFDDIVIDDPILVKKAINFANSFPEGWRLPWYGRPVPAVRFDFYVEEKFIGNFGVSHALIARTYGEFFSQPQKHETIRDFAVSIHPAILESITLGIEFDSQAKEKLKYWERKINELKPGTEWTEVESFLKEHDIAVSHINNNRFNLGYWRNLILETVNDGEYVDTVIKAQLVLDSSLVLQRIRFFGYELESNKKANKAVDTTSVSAPR